MLILTKHDVKKLIREDKIENGPSLFGCIISIISIILAVNLLFLVHIMAKDYAQMREDVKLLKEKAGIIQNDK